MKSFKSKNKIGIALSGGSARALSHIGVLEVLENLGVKIDAVSGTSMGAAIGAFYCMGMSAKEIEDYVYSMDLNSFLILSNITLHHFGIINSNKADEELKKIFGDKTFKDCKRDFCCVAVDIEEKKKVILNTGKLKDAVRASISIPGILSTFYINDKVVVDGGVIEPLPTKAIKTLGVDFIIASSTDLEKYEKKKEKPVGNSDSIGNEKLSHKRSKIDEENSIERFESSYQDSKFVIKNSDINDYFKKFGKLFSFEKGLKKIERKTNKKKPSLFYILEASLNIMHSEMTKLYSEYADIVIEPRVGEFGFFDFNHAKEIIERGRIAAEKKAPEIKKKLRLE